jgi:hypothetical protein
MYMLRLMPKLAHLFEVTMNPCILSILLFGVGDAHPGISIWAVFQTLDGPWVILLICVAVIESGHRNPFIRRPL